MSSRARSNSRSRTPRRAAAVDAAEAVAETVAAESDEKRSGFVQALLTPRVWHVLMVVIVFGTVGVVELHRREHGVVNVWHALLAFFLILNSFIAVCEQHLHVGIGYIARKSTVLIRRYGKGNEFGGAMAWFNTPLTLDNVFHKVWAEMWATYTIFDPCYANSNTFGYWVDSGNGFFTLLPSLALLYNLTYPIAFITPFFMALGSIIVFWTELYGTIIYFWTFLAQGLHRKNGVLNTIVFVGCTNGIWFVVPIIAIYLLIGVLQTNSFAVFQK